MPFQPSNPKPKASHSFSFPATGTTWTIEIYDARAQTEIKDLELSIKERVQAFENVYSRFKSDSLVSELARNAGTYDLPTDAIPMLDMYWELYRATNGLVTPLIGQTLVDAGYDAHYSFQSQSEITMPPRWEDTFEYSTQDHTITMIHAAQLDFGAVGKGYLVDIISELLQKHEIQTFVVDAGGDMFIRSAHTPLTIGLEDPQNTTAILGTASLSSGALCGSAGNRRRWGNYHHIINPTTLVSPERIMAAWVYADSTMLADGLTTSLFMVPAHLLQKQFDFEYILVMDTRSIEMSQGFPGKIFT